jgi:transcriptional regulator with XRE-family HTH domain
MTTRDTSEDTSDPPVRIGHRLRRARQRRQLTIEQLAAATGLTKGFLSQVERDLVSTSVGSLLKICAALDLRVGELFDGDEESGLVRAGERPLVHFGGTGARDELLTPRSQRRIQVLHATVEPGGHSDAEPYPTPTEAQFVHVTGGEFEITIAGETYLLGPGDSLTFSGREQRHWRNPSAAETVELLWVITPSLF